MKDARGALLIGLLVWLSCAWFGSAEGNANNATRLFAAISLVEDHDATIDEFADETIDKARFGDHVYLDKAPGMTLMALPAVWIADRLTGDSAHRHEVDFLDPGFARFVRLRLRLAAASGPAVLTAIAAALLYDLALGLTGSAAAALAAALGYALGTPIWGWSTTIFGHAAVAALYMIATWGIRRGSVRGAVLAGAALGWAVVVEYQAVLAGAVIGVWGVVRWWRSPLRWRSIGAAMAAAVAMLIPLIAYNLIAFATPFRLGYQGVVGFEGMNQGFFGLSFPSMPVLGELLVGTHRGLLWVAPAMAVAAFGVWRLIRTPATREIGLTAALVVATVFLLNASYFYWDGGDSTGPRHAMPMAAMLALGLAPAWMRWRGRWGRSAMAAVLGLSIAINLVIASTQITAEQISFALWNDVLIPFLDGELRTWPSEWLGWSPWAGLSLWAAVALPLGGWIVVRASSIRRVPGASVVGNDR